MVIRSYKCPICNSAFRNESGMNWHLGHKHEIPKAMDALGEQYNAKTQQLTEENSQLKNRVDDLEMKLKQVILDLSQETINRAQELDRRKKAEDNLREMAIHLVARDRLIKKELNLELPMPEFD